MRNLGLVVAFLAVPLALSCASDPRVAERQKSGGPQMRCFDLCAAQLNQCTNRHPGDYTACSVGRQDCEQECNSQAAEQRTEPREHEEVTPLEAEEPTPALEPAPSLDKEGVAP